MIVGQPIKQIKRKRENKMNKLEQLIFKKYKDDEILNPILSRILWTNEETELKTFINSPSMVKSFIKEPFKEIEIEQLYDFFDTISSILIRFNKNPDISIVFSSKTGRANRLGLIIDKIETILAQKSLTRKELYLDDPYYQEVEDYIKRIGLDPKERIEYLEFYKDELTEITLNDEYANYRY